MKYADVLRDKVAKLTEERAALKAEADALVADETRSADDIDARVDEIIARSADLKAEIDAAEKRAAELDALEVERASAPTSFQFIKPAEAPQPAEIRSMAPGEVRSHAMRHVEAMRDDTLTPARKAGVERLLSVRNKNTDGDKIGRYLLATETPAYRSAFVKAITSPMPAFTSDEVHAINEARALSIGTDTAGGFGIPVLIDPSIIITTGTTSSPLVAVSRVEVITNDEWRGVSAAGTAWSFDAEAAEVSDDASSFTQPTVKAHMARGYIPHSIEFGMDYPNVAAELQRLLEVGYDDLLANKLVTGGGTNEPWGIFAALDANTNAEVTVTTNAQFGAVDIDKIWAALPEKWRGRASWLMSVGYENAVRGFGSGTATSRFTVDQTAQGISLLNGRPVLLSDYAPAVATTTTARNLLVVGDFSNYLIAQRAGMSVELVPHVFGTTNNRPTGERGLFAYTRVGADSVLDTAFRVLTNT